MNRTTKLGVASVLALISIFGVSAAPAMAADPSRPSPVSTSDSGDASTDSIVNPAPGLPHWFIIYYSPGCGGGSRQYYDSVGGGQSWINDTFDYGNNGQGNGQKIRNNAASVRVVGENVRISSNQGLSYVDYNYNNGSVSACFNLNAQRNLNTNFQVRAGY